MGGLLIPQTRERERQDELLSAYLDGQLGARERARLEAQLVADPALRAELEALRRTVTLVRDLPSVPIPRNFILAQTMAARPRPARPLRPRRAWAAPFLTAATAVVSLMFVVVLAGDLLLSGVGQVGFAPAAELASEAEAPQVALAPPPVSETVVVEQVEVEAEVEKVLPAPTAAEMPVEAPREAPADEEGYGAETPEEVAPTEPGMGGGGPTEEPPAPAAVAPVAGEATTLTPAPAPSPSPPTVEEAAEAPKAAATATAVPAQDEAAATPTPSEVGEVSPPVTGEVAPEVAAGERGAPEREAGLRARIPPWRVVEAILGLAALGLALATIWAWRARRR
jgi:anti-sigma factor RsiW